MCFLSSVILWSFFLLELAIKFTSCWTINTRWHTFPWKREQNRSQSYKNGNENSTWREKKTWAIPQEPLKAMHKRDGFRCWTMQWGWYRRCRHFKAPFHAVAGRLCLCGVCCVSCSKRWKIMRWHFHTKIILNLCLYYYHHCEYAALRNCHQKKIDGILK